jgi:hypothetical protein
VKQVAAALLSEVGSNGKIRTGQGLGGTEGTVSGDFGGHMSRNSKYQYCYQHLPKLFFS